jgi:putative membrane protein
VTSGKVQAPLPTAMASLQQLNKLKGLKGNDFTKQYHSD